MKKIIAGIDPGTHIVGVCIFKGEKIIHKGIITAPRLDVFGRLQYIEAQLKSLFLYYKVTKVYCEELKNMRNAKTCKALFNSIYVTEKAIKECSGKDCFQEVPTTAVHKIWKVRHKDDLKIAVEKKFKIIVDKCDESDAIAIGWWGVQNEKKQ